MSEQEEIESPPKQVRKARVPVEVGAPTEAVATRTRAKKESIRDAAFSIDHTETALKVAQVVGAKAAAKRKRSKGSSGDGRVFYVACKRPSCQSPGIYIHRSKPRGPLKESDWSASYHEPGARWQSGEKLHCQVCAEDKVDANGVREKGRHTKLLMQWWKGGRGGKRWGISRKGRAPLSMSVEEFCKDAEMSVDAYYQWTGRDDPRS